MKIIKILSSITIISILFIGCSQKEQTVEINESINTSPKKITIEKEIKPLYQLTKNEKEFLKILENDTYASLCAEESKYLQINSMIDSKEKSLLLKELFYTYTNNLSNSCIDQKSFLRTLKKKKYKERKQFYEIYNQSINKAKLLKDYSNQNISIEKILSKYTPKHPSFFPLIKKLQNENLSKSKSTSLRLNIERLKLLKHFKSNNFIQLNIPSHDFTLYENNKKTKHFGTVVGSIEDQTPVLSSKLSYFIVNPTWNIPDSIAKESVIPKALKDKTYLKRKNIVIRKNYKLTSKKFELKDIKWDKYLKDNVRYIPYKFIQLPSNTNGMGRVKFMFSNDYAVYMHDTIGTWRFKSNKEKIRFVSHGCIRLEHPISLMKHISTNYTRKSYKSVRKIYDGQNTGSISLSKRLPVHLTYMTVSINNGKLKFYNDVYGYDKIQKLNF